MMSLRGEILAAQELHHREVAPRRFFQPKNAAICG
jgi:hypothetical protein